MPNIQPSYGVTLPAAIAGQIADMRNRTVVSRIVEGATSVGFGVPVVRGTKDNTAGIVGLTGSPGFLGISVLDQTVSPGATPDVMPTGFTMPVLIKGIIWVVASVSVTPGQPVYFTSGGAFTNVSSGNTAIPNATFETTAGAGALAQLKI